MSRWYLIFAEVVFVLILGVVSAFRFSHHSPDPNAMQVEMKLADPSEQVFLHKNQDGSLSYKIRHGDGTYEPLTPDQMSERIYAGSRSTGALFGITSPGVALWLGLGFLGQVLFTGRMIVQWIASEREKKSVVPPLFWWMSLIGSLLLLAYFLWRRDPIGLIGQAFGSFIYLKNIIWIRNEAKLPAAAAVAQAE